MKVELNRPEWTNLVNIHYGACLSVVAAVSIFVDAGLSNFGDRGQVSFLGKNATWPAFVPMVIYFFVDWISINTRRTLIAKSINMLLIVTIWIWFLGFCVVLAKSPDSAKLVFIGAYLALSALFHAKKYLDHAYTISDGASQAGFVVSLILIAPSVYLCIIGSLHIFTGNVPGETFLHWVLWVVVVIKFIEFGVFSNSPEPEIAHSGDLEP